MTRKILLALVVTFLATSSLSARIKVPVCFPCESAESVKDLSSDEELTKVIGTELNLSYLYNQYGAIWIPIWNSEGEYVLMNEDKTMYYEIDDDTATYLKEVYDIDIANIENPLSFWQKIGGKLAFVLIIGILIWGNIPNKKSESN